MLIIFVIFFFVIVVPGSEFRFSTTKAGAAKAKAYNTCRAPQAATATSEALVMSQAKLA